MKRPHAPCGTLACLFAGLAAIAPVAARADLPPSEIEAVHAGVRDSVLLLRATLTLRNGERTIERPGVVMDTAGRMVASSQVVGLAPGSDGTVKRMRMEALLPSGATIPMRLVLADAGIGAVLLAPERPEAVPPGSFRPVRWAPAGAARPLDTVVVVGRVAEVFGGVSHATPCRINAITDTGRRLYTCALLSVGDGEAVLDRRGRFLGCALAPQTVVDASGLRALLEQGRLRPSGGSAKGDRP